MKFSEAWLREWVNPRLTTDELVAQLTMAGLEINAVEPVAGPFSGLVVGELLEVRPHPNAKKLTVCRVTDGREELQLVCGAPNARAGLKAPLARVGATLNENLRIEAATLRGVESAGMLCSERELGLSDNHAGLMELPADAEPGTDLRDLLQLDDLRLEADLTPNRGDCLSIAGLARELGVLNDLPVIRPELRPAEVAGKLRFPIQVSAPEGCPHYVARVVEGVSLAAPTPLWMRERLRRSGLRSLDPVVDVTNYVMLELGQPLHAFDLDSLTERVEVRWAAAGERLKLLDGRERRLPVGSLLITDGRGPVALAGIMGGAGTAVTADTGNVLLESAFFSPDAIAGRARALGMQTDASHRFERGVDPELQVTAIERATCLLLEIAGGKAGPLNRVRHGEASRRGVADIRLRSARIRRLLGIQLEAAKVERMLARLGFTFTRDPGEETVWRVQPPSHRFDIAIEADLIEEIARIHGYDRLPVTLPSSSLPMLHRKEAKLPMSGLRRRLASLGYHEVITYSFVDGRMERRLYPERRPLQLRNPLSSELDVMRSSLWNGLLNTLIHNRNRQQERVRIFEIGLVFRHSGQGEPLLDELEQNKRVAGLISGPRHAESWAKPKEETDFFDLKGDVEALLAGTGRREARFDRAIADKVSDSSALHPGQSTSLWLGEQQLGLLGRLHPALQASLELDRPVFLFDLDADLLAQGRLPAFSGLSRFPEVRRDLAVLVPSGVPASSVEFSVRRAAGTYLRNLKLFDVYAGKGVDSDKKSLGLALTFQHPARTLEDKEVNAGIREVVAALESDCQATLRS